MRKKELKLVITFSSSVQAMKMEEIGKMEHLPGRLIPVPREITAGCGLAYILPVNLREHIIYILEKSRLIPENIVELNL